MVTQINPSLKRPHLEFQNEVPRVHTTRKRGDLVITLVASKRFRETSTPVTPSSPPTALSFISPDKPEPPSLTSVQHAARLQEEVIAQLKAKNYGKALLTCNAMTALDQQIYSKILCCLVKCVYHGIEPAIEALHMELENFAKNRELQLFHISSEEASGEYDEAREKSEYVKGVAYLKNAISMSIVDGKNYFHSVEDGSRIWSTTVIGLAILDLRQKNFADAILLLAEGLVDREISDLETLYLRGLLSLAYAATGQITEGLNELDLLSDIND